MYRDYDVNSVIDLRHLAYYEVFLISYSLRRLHNDTGLTNPSPGSTVTPQAPLTQIPTGHVTSQAREQRE